MDAFRHFESNAAEAALLRVLTREQRRVEQCVRRGVSHLTKRVMRTLAEWGSAGTSSTQAALQSLLSLPHGQLVGEGSSEACVATCLHEQCNPHVPIKHCKQRCSRCWYQHRTGSNRLPLTSCRVR